MIHHTHPALLEHFSVALVGAGGNGSQMLTILARLHAAMTALGHPGFDVAVFDPDTVSTANIGRQMFSPADVGQSKGAVLVSRVNAFFGLAWRAHAVRWPDADVDASRREVIIACVDSRAARRAIHRATKRATRDAVYLLDLGNRASDGQAVLGQLGWHKARDQRPTYLTGHLDLPHPYDLLPELVAEGDEDDAPSCSLAEALERQELFVNDDVTRAAAQILWQLLRHGSVAWHAAFVNSSSGRRTVVPVDTEVWERMGVRG